eukprot:TRINITY_DN900_c0_g2_i1.p1 TRINITY_DN900_c0_g2~~TRINITY_DN900_c0_g2_i1.p1  ORF type:complete len:1800 (-),score=351.36 TRINITY_DN900_c0_g2_i1:1671-6419(-)
MEKKGLQSSAILLLGIDTGKATLSVRLTGSDVNQATVELSVLQKLQLDPDELLHVLPNTQWQYSLYVKSEKSNNRTLLRMPNNRYQWSIADSVATVDSTGLVTAMDVGATRVVVTDTQMPESTAEAPFVVVNPSKIDIKIFPYEEFTANEGTAVDTTYLVTGRKYVVTVALSDAENHVLYGLEQIQFSTVVDASYLQVISRTPAENRLLVLASRDGATPVYSSLVKIANNAVPPVSANRDATIFSPVTVTPPQVILPPWASMRQYAVQAFGGSGAYEWRTQNPHVATVDQTGVLTANVVGSTKLYVHDRSNPANAASAMVMVEQAVLSMVTTQLETEEGGLLSVSIAAQSQSGQHFANCTLLPLMWAVDGLTFSDAGPLPVSDSDVAMGVCSRRQFRAERAGTSTITCSSSVATSSHLQTKLVCFKPVRVRLPEVKIGIPPSAPIVSPDYIIVTPGASATLSYEQGPPAWYRDPSSFYVTLEPTHQHNVTIAHVDSTFVVTCRELGQQELTLTVTNKETASHRFPAASSATVLFTCQQPHYLLLALPESMNQPPLSATVCQDNAPVDDLTSFFSGAPVVVKYLTRSRRTLAFHAVVATEQHQFFHNSSSLALEWSAQGQGLVWTGGEQTHRTLQVPSVEGESTLRISAVGYSRDHLYLANAKKPYWEPASTLTRELQLTVAANVALNAQQVRLLNNPKNVAVLQARSGSGFYDFRVEDPNVVSVATTGQSTVEVQPLKQGSTKITVTDLCLRGTEPVHADVTVIDVASVAVTGADIVKVGDTFQVRVTGVDFEGNTLSPEMQALIETKLEFDTRHLTLVSQARNDEFIFRGADIGPVRITAAAVRRDGRSIISPAHAVYVYPAFQVEPTEIALLPGATYQLKWSGGPPAAEVSFNITNTGLGEVASTGLVSAKAFGTATVYATSHMRDPVSRQTKIYGTAAVLLTVKEISALKLHAVTTKVIAGSHTKMRAEVFCEGLSVSAESLGLKFKWTSSDNSILKAAVPLESSVCILHALTSGTVRVTASVVGHRGTARPYRWSLSADVSVTVIDPIVFQHPTTLLLPPQTTFQLRVNNAAKKALTYQLLDAKPTSVAIDPAGLVSTKDASGVSYVRVSDDANGLSALVSVEVKPIVGLVTLPTTSFDHEITQAAALGFEVAPIDDLGRVFHSYGGASIDIQNSVPEVVTSSALSSNYSFSVTGRQSGDSLLRVYLATSEEPVADYVPIRVAKTVDLQTLTLAVGARVNFASLFDATSRNWVSSDTYVLGIDADGVGQTKYPGEAVVTCRDRPEYVTKVSVEKIRSVKAESVPTLTNIKSSPTASLSPLRVPLRFEGASGRVLTRGPSSQLDHKVVLQCQSSNEQWVKAAAAFDAATGVYSCELTPLVPAGVKGRPPAYVTVTASASNALRSYHAEARPDVPLRYGFYLRNASSVALESGQRVASVDVYNAPRTLAASTSHPSLLSVSLSAPSTRDGTARCEITVPPHVAASFSDVLVLFTDAATGQLETVTVSYSHDTSRPAPPAQQQQQQQPYVPPPHTVRVDEAPDATSPDEGGSNMLVIWIMSILVFGLTFACSKQLSGVHLW